MADIIHRLRIKRAEAFGEKVRKATGESKVEVPKALPGKAPQIKAPPTRQAGQRTGAEEMAFVARKTAEGIARAEKAKRGAAPKPKVEPEFITKRIAGGTIRVRNPKFKKRKTK